MTKAVSYIRVSTDRQGKSGLGLEAQRSKVAEMAWEMGLNLEKEYREVQTGKSRKRPQLEKALQYCKVTGALLLVPKIDRLARDAAYLMSIYDSGIEVYFGDMPNASGSAGRLMLQMMSSIAEYEGRRISERTKEALAAAKKRGTKLGGYRGAPPPDWKLSVKARKKKADEWAVTLCQTVRELQESGHRSLREIAIALEKMGAKTPTGKVNWQAGQVARIIKRCEALGF